MTNEELKKDIKQKEANVKMLQERSKLLERKENLREMENRLSYYLYRKGKNGYI